MRSANEPVQLPTEAAGQRTVIDAMLPLVFTVPPLMVRGASRCEPAAA